MPDEAHCNTETMILIGIVTCCPKGTKWEDSIPGKADPAPHFGATPANNAIHKSHKVVSDS